MKLEIISFTEQGAGLCAKLLTAFRSRGEECRGFILGRYMKQEYEDAGLEKVSATLTEWTKEAFLSADGVIFIGAAGIAVRAAAPYIKSKAEDPAVVVIDAGASFAISLLSGHLGGANDLARTAAKITGAVPVITTATDVNGRFAVDEFARKNGLLLTDLYKAKRISADILDGRPVGFFSDFQTVGQLPDGLEADQWTENRILVTYKDQKEEGGLLLVPKSVVIGIGCRRGTGEAEIAERAKCLLEEMNISKSAVAAVASIDLKRDEAGLLAFAEQMGVPAVFFTAEELSAAQGSFEESEFVKKTTGVGNVCERAAALALAEDGQNELLAGKRSGGGITMALGLIRRKIRFEGGTSEGV
ncbi:cobalamin biosynthesis protein CbiG [Clostridium sp. MCC353]|uniref:cobalt-precorrin 5A hydrolase n=1 Tax=Clostridium sp. MCC353 TaxID=2592646 RepID=UPI001C0215CE|nr:cobalamin biosynthesis protein [Clostridium sp. MCC353]MBT9779975.1 cobalamin biosynthesis protein CbiG [Clostridium sp. MCC353]